MTNCAELADYEWLTGPQAVEVLGDLAGGSEPLHAAAARLRRQFSPQRTHLVLEQVELRERAAAKFERATEMFFTPLGLEQASDQWVAAYKARRFAGRAPIADLCCGIGGDLLELAAVGPTVGVDRDPIATCLAAANGRALGRNVNLQTCEMAHFNARHGRSSTCVFASWHLDPDRRPAGHRTTSLEWCSPDGDAIERLLTGSPNGAIKLAPAAEVPTEWKERCELEWISRDRQCRQLVAWHGELAESPGKYRATVLTNDGAPLRTVTGEPKRPIPFADQLDRFLFEPDAAVLAAHLVGALVAEQNLRAIAAGVAYLTGPAAIDDPALVCFEIEDVMPLDLRQVARHLRARNIGRLEIKKRGVEHDPATLRKQLGLAGDVSATLILTKLNRKHVAILAQRIHQPVTVSHATCV